MDKEFGKRIYHAKANNDMSGLTFVLIGMVIGVMVNFVFAKALLFFISVILMAFGWYGIRRYKYHYLFFYTSVIFLKKTFSTVVIQANQIKNIEFKELPTITKTGTLCYPILMLESGERVKLFLVYQDEFKQVLDDYKALHGF